MAPVKKKPALKTKKTFKAKAKKIVTKKPVVRKAAIKKPAAKKTVASKAAAKIKTAPEPKGLPEQMLAAALKVLDERQAEEIVTVPLAGRSSLADYMIIATGRAGRQTAAIADHLREAFFKLGVRQVRIEGQGDANWVLVDAGDIVIHLFLPEVRRFYDLDSLWSGKSRK